MREKGNSSLVWTTEDLRNSSTSWSLEGDKALLGLLENIHKNLISHTKSTTDKLDNLNAELCRTSVSLKNVNNRFMGLSNTQFMESSVQEDDVELIKETVNNTSNLIIDERSKPTENKDAEDVEKKEALLQCISKSCHTLEGLCEKIHISPDSDSESDSGPEDMAQSIVLRPKDSYSETPLPHIIGSQKWQKKWHIGLHDCSSESDSDEEEKLKQQEEEAHFSSSEESQHGDRTRDEILAERKSQMSLPIPNKSQADATRSSMTSTSTNNSSDTTDLEVAKINSTSKPSIDEDAVPPLPHQNNEEVNSTQKKAPQKVPNASEFAAELARKLGGNAHSTPNTTSAKSETVKTPQRKIKVSNGASNKNRESEVPGYNPRLSNQPTKRVTGNIFLDEPPPLDTEPYKDDDIFGDGDDEDDDGLFSSKPSKSGPSNPSKSGQFQSSGLFGNTQSNYGGLFDDLPDDDDDFKSEKNVKPSQAIKKSTGFFDESDEEITKPNTKTKGLFDDSDDDFFSKSTEISRNTTNTKSNVSRSNTISKGGIFDESSGEYSGIKDNSKSRGLFDDSLEDFETTKKVIENKNKPTTQNIIKSKGLFEDDDDSDLFSSVTVGKLTDKNNDDGKTPIQKREVKKQSLFGDDSDDDEDLFASLKKNPVVHKKPSSSGVMKKQTIDKVNERLETKQATSKATGLFGETIDTEPEDLFAPLRMPEKKLTDVKKLKECTLPHDSEADKESVVPKKLPGAISTFGNNPNILKEANKLSRNTIDSSSGESEIDPRSSKTTNEIEDSDEKKLKNIVGNISEPKQFAVNEVKSDVIEKRKEIGTKENVAKSSINKPELSKLSEDKSSKTSAKSFLDSYDSDDLLFGKSEVADNSKQNEPAKVQKRSNSLFDDVPPPLDDDQPISKEPRDVNSLFDYDDDEDLFSTIRNITKTTKSKVTSGLFDDLPQEDDSCRETKKPSTVGLFFDEPPDIDDNIDYGDKDEPVIEDGETNMFADYPYYKSVNIIKNSVPKIEDKILASGNISSNEEISKVSVVSDQTKVLTSKDEEIRKIDNTIPVLSDSDSDIFNHLRKNEEKKSIFGELSDDDGDLFSSLLKVKIPEKSSNTDNTSLFEEPKKVLVSEGDLKIEKDLNVKIPFEARTDPSIKVFVDISEDNSKVLKEEIKFKPDIPKSKPSVVKKPEKLKSKPEIINNKPEFLFVKPNSETTMMPASSANSEEVENKLNLENYEAEESKSDTVQKLKTVNKKPEIPSAKPREDKLNYRPEISSKPNIGASETLNVNTDVTDAITIVSKIDAEKRNLKPEIKQAKPEIGQGKLEINQERPEIRQGKSKIKQEKPEIRQSKPEIKQAKPEIGQGKPEMNQEGPEIIQGKPKIKQEKPEIRQSKPEIKQSKPEITTDKPETENKKDKPEIKSDINLDKSEIKQGEKNIEELDHEIIKPDIKQDKPEIKQDKPVISLDKPKIKQVGPEINKVKLEIEQDERASKQYKLDAKQINPEINQEKKKIEAKPEVPTMLNKQEIISGIAVGNSVSELINKVENEHPKQISKEETNITSSSSISDIKAALSKKTTEVVSKSSLDTSEEIDGSSLGTLKNQNISKSENTSPAKIVGKLQMNFNINVKALIPGAAPKLVKEINEERRGSEPFSDSSKGLEAIKSVSFDEEPKSLDSVLSNSLSKDRVKIPVKRRPSSRRARQEAVRKSAADILFSFDETDKIGTNFTTSLPTSPLDVRNILDADSGRDSDILSSLESNRSEIGAIQTIGKLYRDKDIESYSVSSGEYKAVEEDKRETINKDEIKVKVNKDAKTDDIFDIFEGDEVGKHQEIDDDIFSGKKTSAFAGSKSDAKPRLENKSSGLFGKTTDDLDLFPDKETKKPAILFGDESDEDLFSTVKPKVQKMDVKKTVKSQGAIRKTAVKSVFNDSDSDSDLFASKTSTDKGEQKGRHKSKGKSSDIRKQTDVASKNKLFGDSDSEDELFFKPPTHGKSIGSSSKRSESLFDDEGANTGDIFKTNKGGAKAANSIRTQAKPAIVVLSSAELTTQDPLSSFWDD